jgi:hypothetical protein
MRSTPVALTHDCLGGNVSFASSATGPGTYTACVRPGTTVAILLAAPPVGGWTRIQSSRHALVVVTAERGRSSGARTASILAKQQGTALITSTSVFAGDPGGPPSYYWKLQLRIA